ncbi:MAG TPA: indole-3-glycerol phosphate synthase TrpC [Steroidobacteraceae bacterium]|nr:indole-3-glycerol phosphate synthase TrpC [Steroidobacteraceae bacterium]
MNGFLDAMARSSRERVAAADTKEPLAALRTRALATPPAPPLRLNGSFGLIAEYKRRSPSSGQFGNNGLAEQVIAYAEAGAIAVSVVTEPTEFQGSLAHATDAAIALTPLGVPVLRKDFLVDPYQLYETRAAGAGGALLIIRLLPDEQLAEMLACAQDLGLFVLLEAFDAGDIERAASQGTLLADSARGTPVLMGVNCRDLQTLAFSRQRFGELAPLLPEGLPRVAESGLTTPDDCADIVRHGYGLGLVGSALMRAPDPGAMVRTMIAAGRAAA